MKWITGMLILAGMAVADGPGRIVSTYAPGDWEPAANPSAAVWKDAAPVFAENGPTGKPAPGHRTEIRSRWTGKNLYVLFVCPYETLNLKSDPSTTKETNKLWDWDVAEVFIGGNFKNPRHYREYQVSPQQEWVDLDIDRDNPKPEGGWLWNSGYKVKARIDQSKKIWYGEMRIPFDSINAENGSVQPKPGTEMRINFYRLQGPKPNRVMVAWQPTGAPNYHVPEAFGRIVLER